MATPIGLTTSPGRGNDDTACPARSISSPDSSRNTIPRAAVASARWLSISTVMALTVSVWSAASNNGTSVSSSSPRTVPLRGSSARSCPPRSMASRGCSAMNASNSTRFSPLSLKTRTNVPASSTSVAYSVPPPVTAMLAGASSAKPVNGSSHWPSVPSTRTQPQSTSPT